MELPKSAAQEAIPGGTPGSVGGSMVADRPWAMWSSIGWVCAAGAAWMSAWFSAFAIFLFPKLTEKPGVRIDAEAVFANASLVAIMTIVCMPFALAVVILAVRLRGWSLRDYFALTSFGVIHFLVGVLALAGALLASVGIGALVGEVVEPDFLDDMISSLRQGHAVWLMIFSILIVGPVGEEIIFRGFMYRGLSASRIGVPGAIVLCAVFGALAHLQYNLFFVGVVFVLGLVLGALRAWSGSTILPIVLHALINGLGFALALQSSGGG